MKNFKLSVILFLLFVFIASSAWVILDKTVDEIPPMPPTSLDEFYPPKTQQPVYLFSMLEMEHDFTGVVVNVVSDDMDNAIKSYDKFKQSYTRLSKLVPEWEKDYPMEPVNMLGESLKSSDKGKIMGSIEAAGKVCHDCHVKNLVRVQQKYRWKDFHSIKITDPITSSEVDFAGIMRSISMNFTGISVELEEGQIDNARKHFDQFKSRFSSLRSGCAQCHMTERKYFMDGSVMSAIDKLGNALNASSPDSKLIGELSMQIGNESCGNCHLVHTPAALTKAGWRMSNK